MNQRVDCRLELLTMVDTIGMAKDISMDDYKHYFDNSSLELKKMISDLAKHSAAWDVFGMCLNYVGWSLKDYELLVKITQLFMDNVRLAVLKAK